ncbi:MAG: hypothetical protein GY777_12060, partial [Candidatus Brocadiaceae bacterium]|nr:hypothetical protein [Candidatus Brocadiaceae bacterium]
DNTFVNKFFLQSGKKAELLRFITEEQSKTGLLANGFKIKGYEPAKIMVLNPPDKDILRNEGVLVENISINDSSTVLLIDYLGYRILLCGDIGEKGIETLLSAKKNLDVDVPTDIIQVPHHGGFIANTADLVKHTKPKHAIISGLAKDVSMSTIEDYQKHGANLHKTYESGAISFTISKEGIKVSSFF